MGQDRDLSEHAREAARRGGGNMPEPVATAPRRTPPPSGASYTPREEADRARQTLPETATSREEVKLLTAQRALVGVYRDYGTALGPPSKRQVVFRRHGFGAEGGYQEANVPIRLSRTGGPLAGETVRARTAAMTSFASV